MNIQLTFRDFAPSDFARSHVEKRAAKVLERFPVVSARVTLAAPHRHHQHGNAYRVAIDLVLPGQEIVVSPRDAASGHTDLHAAIDDAFEDLQRQLRDLARTQRGAERAQTSE